MEQGVPVSRSYPRIATGSISKIEVHHPRSSVAVDLGGGDLAFKEGLAEAGSASGLTLRVPEIPAIQEFCIRALDVAGSLSLLLIASPVMLLTALLVKVTSDGPVLYKQERVGKGGNIFTLYKFRSMVNDAEKHVGPVWATRDDDRVTPVGKLIRRIRIDELPQLLNIVNGDMSLVGPRPERPFFVDRHEALQGVRLAVKPGLTGLAQVRAFYDLKPERKLRYDCLYIQNRSFLLNVSILLKTIPVVLRKTGW